MKERKRGDDGGRMRNKKKVRAMTQTATKKQTGADEVREKKRKKTVIQRKKENGGE